MSPEPSRPAHPQLRQKVAERIRLDILEGRLKPGEWLRQERLATDYHTSQMPVREALKQLAAEGLIEHVPYRGVRVVQLSSVDVLDLYACRAAIESMAAWHAATAITDEELAELAELQRRMIACHGDAGLAECRSLNRRFHEIIFTASRRPFLIRTLSQLWDTSPTMLWASFGRTAARSSPQREAADNAEHAAILAAMQARDADAAAEAMRRHIAESGRHLVAAL
jgi:DNA-binding GntR family transcriptional regulator